MKKGIDLNIESTPNPLIFLTVWGIILTIAYQMLMTFIFTDLSSENSNGDGNLADSVRFCQLFHYTVFVLETFINIFYFLFLWKVVRVV